MKEPTIHVLQVEPHKYPQRMTLQNDLDNLQQQSVRFYPLPFPSTFVGFLVGSGASAYVLASR